jgi:hypothetical protein
LVFWFINLFDFFFHAKVASSCVNLKWPNLLKLKI